MWIVLGWFHFIRALCIAIIPTALQNFLNWIFEIHMIEPYRIIKQFDFSKMIVLVIFTFIVGWFMWRILGLIINQITHKKK